MALIKQQPYFPHYATSRTEMNIMIVRGKVGTIGYAVYFMLLERLRISEGYIEELDLTALSRDFEVDEDIIGKVVDIPDLFNIYDDGEGRKFYESIELTSYMNFMEEKKKRRRQAAITAANARWGKSNNGYSAPAAAEPIYNEEDPVVEEFATAMLVDSASEEPATMKIDKEIQEMSKDTQWIDYISKELDMTADAIVACFEKFRLECIRNGRKSGHRDLRDTMSHFRSWMKKSGLAGSKTVADIQTTTPTTKAEQRELKRRQEIDRRHEERKQNYDRMQREKMSTADYIRNKGYDPEKVTMVMMMKPGWVESNPPTHPEWIGKYCKKQPEETTVDVPF